jgi:hypothetical protein
MKVINIVFLLCLVQLLGCDNESNQPSRGFYMGFIPLPAGVSQEVLDESYKKIASSSDIINHHFDQGIPWEEALANSEFPSIIMNDWMVRKQNTPSQHKVYVSVSVLSHEGTGLARSINNSANSGRAAWSDLQFNNKKVKAAYVNYCTRIIRFFGPDYFNMNADANLLYFRNPGEWSAFLQFHQHVYQELKKEFPKLTIFSSVTAAPMVENYFPGNDHIRQKLAALQILAFSDMFGLSFYTRQSATLAKSFPENAFDRLLNLTLKPLAITETAYPSQGLKKNRNFHENYLPAGKTKHETFMESLLKACEKYHAEFAISFALENLDTPTASNAKKTLGVPRLSNKTGIDKQTSDELSVWQLYFEKDYNR